ncbi:Hsp20/alpha crystallin family protein [Ascidiimonas sp. W6]|uniref:Hsp20/alpha crystallin family protein n=1 Tax=Ascidiimonas meishanensis TaxID=3128903 RepID=UPI0030EFA14E
MNLVRKNNNVWFPSLLDEFLKPDWMGGLEHSHNVLPAVNIKESEDHFDLELSVPGFKKDDIHIEVDDNVLTISSTVESSSENKDEKGNYTRREFSRSSFKRSFTLPETVNEDAINASYEDGILVLTFPKKEEALPKPKRLIEIS